MYRLKNIYLHSGQTVFLVTRVKRKIKIASVKNWAGKLNLTGDYDCYFNEQPPELKHENKNDSPGLLKRLLTYDGKGIWLENHDLVKIAKLEKKEVHDFFSELYQKGKKDFLCSSDNYQLINISGKIQEFWIREGDYNQQRESILNLALQYRLKNRKNKSHHQVEMINIGETLAIKKSINSRKLSIVKNEGDSFLLKAGIEMLDGESLNLDVHNKVREDNTICSPVKLLVISEEGLLLDGNKNFPVDKGVVDLTEIPAPVYLFYKDLSEYLVQKGVRDYRVIITDGKKLEFWVRANHYWYFVNLVLELMKKLTYIHDKPQVVKEISTGELILNHQLEPEPMGPEKVKSIQPKGNVSS